VNVSSENVVGAREIFSLVWLSIELIFNIEILTYLTADNPKQEAFWRDSSPTIYIIIGSWWQHHQTKLPMARMFTKYMLSLLQNYDLNAINVVIQTG
jgi:hypothetical protein